MDIWSSVQKNMTWKAVPIATFLAGTIFLIIHLVVSASAFEIEPALLLRYYASLILGNEVLLETGSGAVVVGIIVHYLLSFFFTLLVAIVVHRWGLLVGIIGGAILGLAVYGLNLYLFTVLFEWFFAIDSYALLLSHIAFGATAGGIYELFDHYDEDFDLEVS